MEEAPDTEADFKVADVLGEKNVDTVHLIWHVPSSLSGSRGAG